MNFKLLTLIGLVLGVLAGIVLPSGSVYTAVFGEIFLNLLKLIIIPLVLVSCFLGFADVASTALLRRLGVRTVAYYAFTSVMAGLVGIACVYLFLFGVVDVTVSDTATHGMQELNIHKFILLLFPQNFFKSLSEGQILHVVFIALATGLAAHFIHKNQKETLVKIARSLDSLIMMIVHAILYLLPIGIFSLVYSAIAKMHWSQVASFGGFFLAVFVAAFFHACITLPVALKFFGRYSPLKFFMRTKEALVVALSTASSSGTLPVSMTVMKDNVQADEKVVDFVLPLGATLNMDGSALYQSILIVFMAKMAGMDLSFAQIAIAFIIIMFSSAGVAGIPAGGTAMVAMVMNMVGIPMKFIGIYFLVDRFLDNFITSINVWGDLIGAQVVSAAVSNEHDNAALNSGAG